MTITAKVIASSVHADGSNRLVSVQCRYMRFFHAEHLRHRAKEFCVSSSRAIPVKRLIQDVLDDTAMPIHWGKNEPGMQAREEHDALILKDQMQFTPEAAWNSARDDAIGWARAFDKAGYHKQVVNRLIEPFAHVNVLFTSTMPGLQNFFALRDHPDAQPENKKLAIVVREALADTQSRQLKPGEWHLPYVTDEERAELSPFLLRRLSAARCARVSYLTHEMKPPTVAKDLELFNTLANAVPMHASPMGHQATPAEGRHYNLENYRSFRWGLEHGED